jgi:hypothetical protein
MHLLARVRQLLAQAPLARRLLRALRLRCLAARAAQQLSVRQPGGGGLRHHLDALVLGHARV